MSIERKIDFWMFLTSHLTLNSQVHSNISVENTPPKESSNSYWFHLLHFFSFIFFWFLKKFLQRHFQRFSTLSIFDNMSFVFFFESFLNQNEMSRIMLEFLSSSFNLLRFQIVVQQGDWFWAEDEFESEQKRDVERVDGGIQVMRGVYSFRLSMQLCGGGMRSLRCGWSVQ